MTATVPQLRTGLKMTGLLGGVGSAVLLALLVAWAQFTLIGGAVISPGQAVVRGKPKMVQSLDGGIVERIDVVNGDFVTQGDLLMRLDPTLLQVNLDIARTRLAEALALKARLTAEQLDEPVPQFDNEGFSWPALPFEKPDTAVPEAVQRQIFQARHALLTGQREQLGEKVQQFRHQISGVEGMIAAQEEQLALLERELGNIQKLFAEGLTRESQMLELQRARAGLMGEIAENRAEIARIENAIRDAELEVVQAERQFKEKVVTDLGTATRDAEELVLEIVTTTKQLGRIDIRAPASGIVHEMQVTTVGGVVSPGGTIMQVIPSDEGVEFELKLEPRYIDQVHVGQKAQVVFPSFDPRATPRVDGHVTAISPTSVVDQATGQSFYRLELSITPEEIARLGDVEFLPGMPVEAFLETGDRSALSYLLHPLTAQLNRAFREK